MKEIGLTLESPKASLYVWARVPDGLTSAKFAEQLLEERDVLMIPGGNYGVNGEGYVRLSLTLEDDKIDAVVISTPVATHFDIAKLCLEAGKHILVEKPISLSGTDVVKLQKISKRNKRQPHHNKL